MKAIKRRARFGGPYVVDAFLRSCRRMGANTVRPLSPLRMSHSYLLLGIRTEQVTTRTLLQTARLIESASGNAKEIRERLIHDRA